MGRGIPSNFPKIHPAYPENRENPFFPFARWHSTFYDSADRMYFFSVPFTSVRIWPSFSVRIYSIYTLFYADHFYDKHALAFPAEAIN